MTFPSNPLEQELQRLANGTTTSWDFLQRLIGSTVFVSVSDVSGDGEPGFSLIDIEGVQYLPVYTSEEQLHRGGISQRVAVPPVRELLKRIPTEVGLVVNMGGDLGFPISAGAIQEARVGVVSLEPGTRLRIGEPAIEPRDLLGGLSAVFSEFKAVRTAGRCWAQTADSEPGLVISVDLDPDNPETRETVVARVRGLTAVARQGFMVDLVFAADRSVFTEWIEGNSGQFYS